MKMLVIRVLVLVTVIVLGAITIAFAQNRWSTDAETGVDATAASSGPADTADLVSESAPGMRPAELPEGTAERLEPSLVSAPSTWSDPFAAQATEAVTLAAYEGPGPQAAASHDVRQREAADPVPAVSTVDAGPDADAARPFPAAGQATGLPGDSTRLDGQTPATSEAYAIGATNTIGRAGPAMSPLQTEPYSGPASPAPDPASGATAASSPALAASTTGMPYDMFTQVETGGGTPAAGQPADPPPMAAPPTDWRMQAAAGGDLEPVANGAAPPGELPLVPPGAAARVPITGAAGPAIDPRENGATSGGPGVPAPYAAEPTPNELATGSSHGQADLGTGLPGEKRQEGLQTAQLQIEKVPPEEAKVGLVAKFTTIVRNVGPIAARGVEVVDMIPRGARLVATNPPAARGENQTLVWRFESIQPGAELAIEMEVMPIEEGEIGSIATVRFAAEATARTLVTRPLLEVATSVPPTVNIGEEVAIDITLTNPGTGTATGVFLEEAVPAGLEHPAGLDIRYTIGDLMPGDSKQLTLKMKCVKPGTVENVLVARADAGLEAQSRAQFDIVAPSLKLEVVGAKQRFLEQQAVYHLAVSNPGTASARNLELAVYLPENLKFEGTDEVSKGQYDPQTHTVHWTLRELPVNKQGVVELKTVPVGAGEGSLRFVGSDATGLSAESVHPVLVDGIASVSHEVIDSADPIETGRETTYEIHVTNQGTKDAANVQVFVQASPELRVTRVEGPTTHRVDASGNLAFQPLARLQPKMRTTYKVTAQGVQPGDGRLRVQVVTADMTLPVTKEESTKVFDGS